MKPARRITPAVADVLLLLCAAIWGVGFLWQKWATKHVGAMTYVSARCLLGGLVVLPLVFRRRPSAPRGTRSTLLVGGLLTGACMAAGSGLQQLGIETTTMTNAGFITSLYVVFVPFLGVLAGQRVAVSSWCAILLAGVGLYWLSFHGKESFSFHQGDLFVLACAFTWAIHVQVVGWASRRSDPIALSVLQFFVAGAIAAGFAFWFESPSIDGVVAAAWPIALSAVFSVGIAFTFQAIAQDVAPPTHTAILLSLESVFAAATGVAWLGEEFGAQQAAGAAAMLGAVFVAQWPALRRRIPRAAGPS